VAVHQINKICTKCGANLLATTEHFHRAKYGKYGLSAVCKSCRAVHHKQKPGYAKQYNLGHQQEKKLYRQEHKERASECKKLHRKTVLGCLRGRFDDIKKRCTNPNCEAYKNYGGRGIKCLFESSDAFVHYVTEVLKVDPRQLQIDRIDNDGNYEPGNIQLVTPKENANNRRKRGSNL